jgi:hypothetical protein
MSTQSHIFNPHNHSFDERIRSYKSVLDAYRNLEASRAYQDDQEWADRLGTAEDMTHAEMVIENSLKVVMDFVMPSEIVEAIGKGLLTSDDAQLIAQIERQQDIQSFREDKQADTEQNQQRFGKNRFKS